MSKRAFSLKAARRNQHLPLPFVSRRRDMMVRPAAAFALPLTLAACAVEVPPETPPPPAAAYMALGTEPGWTLEITPDRLNYDGDYGETKIVVAKPGARPSVNGERYVTARDRKSTRHAESHDRMSDRRAHDMMTGETGAE